MDWIEILQKISIWIIIMPAITGLILFRRLDNDSWIVLIVVLIGCIPQLAKFFIDGTSLKNIVYNVYTPVEFIAYWILFRRKILTPSRRKILDGMAAVFILVSLYVIYSYDFSVKFISAWVALRNIFQVSWVGLCLLEYYYAEESLINSSQPFFWFLIAITIYASSTAIYFSLYEFIESNKEHFQIVTAIHHIFNILLYIFFTIGFLKNSKLKHQPWTI